MNCQKIIFPSHNRRRWPPRRCVGIYFALESLKLSFNIHISVSYLFSILIHHIVQKFAFILIIRLGTVIVTILVPVVQICVHQHILS